MIRTKAAKGTTFTNMADEKGAFYQRLTFSRRFSTKGLSIFCLLSFGYRAIGTAL
jgi:hypothetical protein